MEIKQKLKSCLSMLIAFTVGFSCISPTAFADENNLGAKRKQVIGVADRILERDDLATRFRGTTYTDNENYDNFSDTLWYNTWENAQKWKFKANGLSENECDNAIGEMLYNEAVYGFPMSHFLKKDGLYKGPYKIVKVKKIAGKKYYQEIYKKEKDSDNNDIELNDIKALFDENVRIIKEGNSYDIQMNVKTDKVQSLSAAYINRIAGKEVYREYIKDPVNNEKDGGFLLGGIPGELTGENIVVFDMTYVDASGSKRTLEPFGVEIDYAALQRKNDWELPNYKKNLLDKAQEFQMNTSAIMSSEDAKYVDEHKKKIIDKALSEIDEFIKSDDISYDRFYEIANPIIDMEYGFKMIPGIKNMIDIHKSSIGTLYTNKTYSQKSLDEFEKYLDDLEKDLTFKTLKDLVLDSYKVNNASMIMLRYNTSKLEELIKQAGAKKQSDYTVESYLKMLQVKAEAEKWVELCKVYKDPSNETSTLEKKLEKALKDLVPTKPEVEKVKLTLIGENITSTPQAGDIEKGTEIVITLTPDTNKVVKVFTVNDVDKKSKLQDNKYKFNIQENTTVKVEYENKPQIEEKVYTVDVKFLNADGIGSLSMANQCLDSRAKLVMGKENKLMLKLMPMYKENSPTGIIDKIYYYDIDHTKVELKTLETKKIKISYQEYEQEYVYPTKVEMPVDGESNKISMHMTVKSPMLGNDPHPNDAILTIDYENKTDGYEEEQDNDKKKELSDAVYYLQEGLKTYSYLIPPKMQKETRNLIAEGKKVLNNYSATPEQIDEMLAKITKQREKINKLISVHRLYEDAKATYKDDVESGKYSKESMEAMKKVLDRAAELISKQDITDEDIDELLSMDLANIYKLERYNTSKLQEEIKKSKEVLNNGKTYTKETKEALEIVIEKAEKYVNDAKETRWIADERESLIKELQEKVGELKVTQAPEVDKTPLVNKIAEAEAIAQGKKTDVAYQELQNAIQTAKQKLNTINTVEALKNAVNELQAAIDKFNSSADIPQELDKTPLVNKIAEAEAIAQGKKTDVAYQELQNAIQTAKQKLNTINTVEDLQAAVNELDNAINTFKLSADAPETPLQKLYREFSEEIEAAKSLTDEGDKFPQAYNVLQSAIEKAETELNENKDNIHALKLSFNNFKISVVEYKDSNYTALEEIENILKQKDPDEYIMAQGVISATIYKLNDQEPSMADKSLVKPVRILLTNKGYRLVLAFRSANMGFLKGFLGELYADKNQGFNILEPISTYNVIDVYNDPETGKDIKMKGNKYPKETIVSIDKNTNLLPVKVYIPALENMSPGDGTKKANIQFDWNTLEINKVFTTSLKNKIAEAESITQGKKTSAAYQELQNAVQTAKQKLNTVNTIDDLQNAVNELQAAIDKFNSSADIPQELDKTPLVNKIAEAEAIAQGKKTDAAYQELQNAVQTAKQKLNTVNTIADLQNAVNELQVAINKFNSSADVLQEKVYTVNAKLIQIDTTTPMTLGTSMNKTVKLSEKNNTVKYEIQFKPFTENGKTLNIVELYSIENGESKKAKIIENSADEYNKTFIFTRQTLQEPDIMLDILTDLNIDKKENMQKFSLVFDWTTKKDFKKEPEKPVEEKVNLTLTGENISSNPAAGQITKGTNVTVTVVPASNKEVQSFTVNGADKKSDLINNQYTFNIDRDTQINVEYKDITSPGNNNSGSGGGGGSSSSSENSGSTERGSSNNTVKETKQNETVTITEEEVAKSAPSVKNIKFKDVKDNHWAIDAIKFLAQKGIMVGTGNGNFEPNGKLSKVMLISILARISGDEIENAEKTNFTDIPQNAWYKNDVAWAVKIGIISVSGNKFNPNASLTRSETTVIIGKYLGNKNIKLEETNKQINFKDSKDIPASSMQYVEKLAKYGIIKGDASGKFNPESSLTRAETASIITRLIKAVGK